MKHVQIIDNVIVAEFCCLQDYSVEIDDDDPRYIDFISKASDTYNLVTAQYFAIDAHIAQCIKSNGWDYDNIGEIAAYALLSETYKVEARAVWAWVEACQAIQTDIKNGVVKYDSVEAALKEIPLFDVHA